MANKTDNYCQLLGLNPFNDKYTQEAIDAKIDKMAEKWANEHRNKQNDTGTRFKYSKLCDQIPEIKSCMSNPACKKRVFADGQKNLTGKCQRLKMDCVILADGRYIILGGVVDNFVKRLHWEGIDKKLAMKLANVNEGPIPKRVSDKVENAYISLNTVDAYTPTDVLNMLIKNPDLEIKCDPLTEGSSLSQVRNAFTLCEKRVNSVRQDILPDQDSYISVLRSLKLIIDSDKEMNDLFTYGRCNRAMDPAKEIIEKEYTGSQITRNYIDDIMSMYSSGQDQEMCIYILETFCFKKKIPANFSNLDSNMTRCPYCSNLVPSGSNTMFCPFCGKNFKMVCPQCKTTQQSKNVICIKCGFNFKEGEMQAKNLAISFNMNMQKGSVTQANADLQKLKSIYSTYATIPTMENEIGKARTNIDTLIAMISDNHKMKRFYAAKVAGDTLMQSYAGEMISYPDVKQKYDESVQHVKQADVYCNRAKISADRDTMLGIYVSAINECPDHPAAKAVLKQHPPSGPDEPQASIKPNGNLMLKYSAPVDSKGITFVIYRNRNSILEVTDESRPLAEIPGTVYIDRSLEPGVEYYYSVYTKRWGILSREAVHYGPIMILAEVEKVNIEHIDGGLRLMYEKPHGASRVRVWRADPKTQTNMELPINGATVYDDLGLKGGCTYHYLFVAEYETRNRSERSAGNIYTATTLEAPKPVRDWGITWMKNDGSYRATWSTKERVQLYASKKKYNIQGNMIKMEDINAWMTPIQPLQEYEDGMKFNLPDGTVQYLYPIIQVGPMGIKGNEIMVANLRPFRDVEKVMSGKDCILTMTWPPNAVAAKIVISSTDVKDLDDPTAEIMTVRKEEYDEDKMIRIPMGKAAKKCINIFAIYDVGNETLRSRGIAIDIYSAECKKVKYKIDKGGKRAELQLTTDSDIKKIPEVALVHVDEGIPLKRTDGEVIWSSGGNIEFSGGACSIPIDLSKYKDVEHIRLFFVNEEDYNLFRFIHPLYRKEAR
jgi:predicted RNA-binding Zn-ribbon protein involved in translation (DUF1610 family)